MHRFNNLFLGFAAPTSSLLCSNVPDDDPPGGGDGGGDEPKPMSPEEQKRFIANAVNSSVSTFMKRDGFKNTIAEAVNASVGNAVKEALSDFKPPTPPAEPEGGTGGNGVPDPRDLELKKVKSEQEKMRQSMEANKAEVEAERTKAKVAQERAALSEALRANGVDANRLPGAIAHLYLGDKRIKRNPDPDVDPKLEICMTFQREWGEELVPIDKGVAEYLKTDAGKVYVPPVDAGGSGNQGGRANAGRPRAPGEKPSRPELVAHLGQQMMDKLNNPG